MRFALMTEPQQGLTYEEILAAARTAEEAGIEAFFRSDHYSSFPGESGLPTTDAWTTLAGLARETSRIRLGALVSPVTFRIPGSFAKVIQTADEMSGGRRTNPCRRPSCSAPRSRSQDISAAAACPTTARRCSGSACSSCVAASTRRRSAPSCGRPVAIPSTTVRSEGFACDLR